MDGEHDINTAKKKTVQPYILRESAKTLAHELAEDNSCSRQRKRESQQLHVVL